MISYNVAQLLKAPVGTTRRYRFREEPASYAPDILLLSALEGQALLTRTSRGILVQSTFETRVEVNCSRCLEPCEALVEGHIEEEFLPTTDIITGETAWENLREDNFRIDADHVLDLTEAVRQEILLQLPLQPLHSPECLGLCVQCGHNLNRGKCACEEPVSSSPFGVLAQFFSDSDNRDSASPKR